MQQNYEVLSKNNINVLAINGTVAEGSSEKIKNYAKENNLPFKVLLDIKGDVFKQYLVRGVPVTFGIDSEGKIQYKHLGVVRESEIHQIISKIK